MKTEQRPMIFRVFNVETQEYDTNLIPNANIDHDEGTFFFIETPAQLIVEQYTGMDVPNKYRVFENDVVKIDEKTCRVAMENGSWSLLDADGRYYSLLRSSLDRGGVVVGTIHDKNIWTQ